MAHATQPTRCTHCRINDPVAVAGHANGPGCVVYEYVGLPAPFDAAAEARITDSYPARGYVVNRLCDELLYVAEGWGGVATKAGETFDLKRGDTLLIPKGTAFRYDIGPMESLRLFVTTSPKFTPERPSSTSGSTPEGARASGALSRGRYF